MENEMQNNTENSPVTPPVKQENRQTTQLELKDFVQK